MLYYKKSQPGPECLQYAIKTGEADYDCEGVLDQLLKDYHRKCYICGVKNFRDVEIEHLNPKSVYPDQRLKWDNLFLVCRKCNGVKNKDVGVLDCSDPLMNLDALIKLEYTPQGHSKILIQKGYKRTNKDLKSTLELLRKIYNGGRTANAKRAKKHLREMIKEELDEFLDLLDSYYSTISYFKRKRLKKEIQARLTNKSKFTEFKRWIVIQNEKYYWEFQPIFLNQENS